MAAVVAEAEDGGTEIVQSCAWSRGRVPGPLGARLGLCALGGGWGGPLEAPRAGGKIASGPSAPACPHVSAVGGCPGAGGPQGTS